MFQNRNLHVVSVFYGGPNGGNPAPIVLDADGMSDAEMREVAQAFGHESGFVLSAPAGADYDLELRFWVPNHEMSMCGHATVGAVWLLNHLGRLERDHLDIMTKSGRVRARIHGAATETASVEISQPAGRIERLPEADETIPEILSILGLTEDQLAPFPIQNACTSRVKTLVPLASAAILDNLQPDYARVEALCTRIGSTGLYPYAVVDGAGQIFDARQFPQSSGYPEDAATGIAAAALSFGLLANGLVQASDRPITIRQGRAMKRPSEIAVRFQMKDSQASGCWLGGQVRIDDEATLSHEPA